MPTSRITTFPSYWADDDNPQALTLVEFGSGLVASTGSSNATDVCLAYETVERLHAVLSYWLEVQSLPTGDAMLATRELVRQLRDTPPAGRA